MSLGGILILLTLLVSLIVFIYLIVVTARGWGAFHTVLLCFLFIECWVFIVMAAGVQGTRVKFTKAESDQQERATKAAEETQRLMWGTFDAQNLNLEAVVPTRGELRRTTNDRGRVWRQVNLIQPGANAFQLELSAADTGVVDEFAADGAAAAPAETLTSESLPVDLVVYAFSEEDMEGTPVPTFYLGEYKVTQSQDGAVTLQPTLQLSPMQRQRIQSGAATAWTLYELLPVDSHEAFAARGSGASDEAIFGRMDSDALNELFSSVPATDGRQQKLIDSYLRDGSPANNNDVADSVWVQLNMTKSKDIDVNSEQDANAEKQGFYDQFGRAIDARLKREGEGAKAVVKLNSDINERIVMNSDAAQKLISEESAELVQRFYVRELIDYHQAFNIHSNRMKDIQEQINIYKRETALLQKANQEGQAVISDEQVQYQQLTTDLQNYRKEVTVLEGEAAKAKSELASLKQELSSLFRLIQSASN